MAVRTGVDLVTQIIDQTPAGAASVERSVRGMGERVTAQGSSIGQRYGANLAGAIISGLAAAGIDRALETALDAHRAGESIGLALGEGLAETLRGIPVSGPLGEVGATMIERWNTELRSIADIAASIARSVPQLRPLAAGIGQVASNGESQAQEREQRRSREEALELLAKERVLERRRDSEKQAEERQRQVFEREIERRRQEADRQHAEELRRQEADHQHAEELRRQEADRAADLQRARAGSVAGAEGRLAGVTDSRGLSGRAAEFLQIRNGDTRQVALLSDVAAQLRKLIDVNKEQLREMEQNRFVVVGN